MPRKMADSSWKPTASLDAIRKRANLLQQVRAFFHVHNVMEVDTPTMSLAGNTDPNVESFSIQSRKETLYLHTSPEFTMKRLLAAGSGSIYQVCKVFRQDEFGQFHNFEFTMLEWYRVGYDYHLLMDEVESLLKVLLEKTGIRESVRISYQQAFMDYAGFDPMVIENMQLVEQATSLGFGNIQGLGVNERDAWLELLFDQVVVPKLPNNSIVFVYDYPASQAALAKIRKDDGVAERFEVYINGIELANGFNELTDASEQRFRFMKESKVRAEQGKPVIPVDEQLLNALASGLPDCAGVALGLDRLLMLLCEVDSLQEVMTFQSR